MTPTGDEYFDSDEFQELLSSYEEAIQSDGAPFMDADDLTDIAEYYHMTGRIQEADRAIELALHLHPDATQPLVFKAREALMNGQYEEAHHYIEQMTDNDDPDYQYIRVELLVAEGRIEEADELLRTYFATIPPDEYQDFVMDAANIYVDYGYNDKAYEWMMRTKGDDSNDFKELMARTLFGLGKYKDSADIFNELIDRDPYSTRYWNALANAQFMNEDFSGSVASSEFAIAIDPNDPDGLLSKANGLFRLGNYEEAINYYDRYLSFDPSDDFSLLHKGSCYVNLGQHERAAEVLDEALTECAPDSPFLPQIYQELAFAYSAMRQPEKALSYIDKTRSLDCDHIDMLVLRGHILLENGRVDEAEEVFKNAIIRSDSAPSVLLRIMVSLYDNKYVKACYEMFKKFFTLVDDNFTDGYSYMALCCWDMGHTEEFLMYLRIAVDRNPREARLVLGHLFPEDMAAKDYYKYMYQQINRTKK